MRVLGLRFKWHTLYVKIENVCDPTSDHSPLILSLSNAVLHSQQKNMVTNKLINWDSYRKILNDKLNLKIRLTMYEELETTVTNFTAILKSTATATAPSSRTTPVAQACSFEILNMVRAKRKARHKWQQNQTSENKTALRSANSLLLSSKRTLKKGLTIICCPLVLPKTLNIHGSKLLKLLISRNSTSLR